MARRVAVFGAGGRMGSTVCRAVMDDPDLELVAVVDPHHAGLDLRQVTGLDTDLVVDADADGTLDAGAELRIADVPEAPDRPRALLLNAALALSLADRAYVIEGGRVMAEGTAREIAASPELADAYLGASTPAAG